MKLIGYVLLACLILGALQYAMVVLTVMLILLALWGCIFRPREMLGIVTYIVILGLLQVHPWFCFAVIVFCTLVWAFRRVGTGPAEKVTPPKLLEYKPQGSPGRSPD